MQTAALLFDHGNEVATVAQTYDGMGRLTGIGQKHGSESIAEYLYSWDAANRITSLNDAQYGYDQTSQLVSAEYDTLPSEAYEYDANGNRKSHLTGTLGYTTGKNNQLLSDGVFDYTYDDEGNRIAKTAKTSRTEYVWDHRNRLVKVVDNGKSIEYDYDYQNRLVRRNDELFVHDGWQIACSINNSKIVHRYLWGAAQDELLAMDDCWALRDHLNTVRKVVDAKGCVVASLEYNAFGALVNATGEMPLFRYTGKLFDNTTALQWNINRWYDAGVGRWISEDPIGFVGQDMNLARYVNNTSTMGNDPDGQLPCWCKAVGLCLAPGVVALGSYALVFVAYEACLDAQIAAPGVAWTTLTACTLFTGGSVAVCLGSLTAALYGCLSLVDDPDCKASTKERIQDIIDSLVNAVDTFETIAQQLGINLF